MSKNKAMVLVAASVAVVVVVFVLIFRDSVNIRAIFPFGTEVSLKGGDPSPPGPGRIEGEGLDAGGDLSAENRVGGDVRLKDAKAQGDIDLSIQATGGNKDPKH
ncbi:hypothetical protein [Candidatus Thiosymbion oneisti]|uniref:hypothetical protein n=1 Tax=Candidatus Thiosymbion oneisti TaxID=589554 RepID=UPI00114CAAD8|nr:hypothetical protein [Candidatus Thiosymbion oneisti]